MSSQKLLLQCSFSLGDIVMLTAAVRDLHHAYPGQFVTGVQTPFPELWEHNPNVTPLHEDDPEVRELKCRYPLINRCNRAPYHCLHGFIEFLNEELKLSIRPTEFRGDIHLSQQEKLWYSQVHELTRAEIPYWIVSAGGKYDVSIKWWNTERYQQVMDHFQGRIQFVQVGEWGHHHPRLNGVIDLRGKTTVRELLRLVHHAQGILCGVTGLMHLAAAVPARGKRGNRPCVVVAGGREPAHWEAYPDHQFIHTTGALPCCSGGGCWKDRTTRLRDGDRRDRKQNLCVEVTGDLPRCMDMITPAEVIRRIELYFAGGSLEFLSSGQRKSAALGVGKTKRNPFDRQPLNIHNAGQACDRFIREMPQPVPQYKGRGIVICGGGVQYFTNAWVCINMLRQFGCGLPIQLWHLGRNEVDKCMAGLVEPLGVECVDASIARRRHPVRILGGWALKSYALLHNPFRETLLLDADNVPVINPEHLFDSVQYHASGAVFWPDYGRERNKENAAIWKSCGLRIPDEPEFESGQIVVDKSRCWQALRLSLWFNENSDFYYRYLYGDKETFHLAFRKLKAPYALVPHPIRTLTGTMCQHDFDGSRIFQHRNRDKWDLSLRNRRVKGFLFEEDCRRYVRALAECWDGRVNSARVVPLVAADSKTSRTKGMRTQPAINLKAA